jgi:RHH-type transcriptional regulator, proline utilization regulon repressor / proline dehydrogenase / delta 1-pyrroline-5-carboxylate dehydrogenase
MALPSVSDSDLGNQAIKLAENLLGVAIAMQTRSERKEATKLARLINDPVGKAFTFAMVDQVFRSHNPSIASRRWRRLLRTFGVPRFLPLLDRVLIQVGAIASHVVPGIVMMNVAARMRSDSARVILPGEKAPLHRYLQKRKVDGFRINLNHLGEAVLGEEEALHRFEVVSKHLDDPAIEYVSIKISSIFSQISLIAWSETLVEIKDRLRILYRRAQKLRKFVNLDMEEYRDLHLTVSAFRELLDEPEFLSLSAGIVLQAYLPESFLVQKELTEWAQTRLASGGAQIKIRLVKGANLAMEAVEAELHGWNPAPYPTKADTDANFRRMLEFGCLRENAQAVRLGVASHNLFDVALALTLRDSNGVAEHVEIEMLEGMANHQARAVREAAGGLLLYSPVVKQPDFLSAMAYLVRRLDENTAPENFLRQLFAMHLGSAEWEDQKRRFIQGWVDRNSVSSVSRRSSLPIQFPFSKDGEKFGEKGVLPGSGLGSKSIAFEKRAGNEVELIKKTSSDECDWHCDFKNQPDSDWTQPAIRRKLEQAIEDWQPSHLPELPELERMLESARMAQCEWNARGLAYRSEILYRAAAVMSQGRYETLACLRLDGKKAIAEADGEVSEAIDFARYYANTAQLPSDVSGEPLGIVAVVSPWNFPYAIPAGGVLAALIAGNSVILKPSRATLQIAWLLTQQLWQAGIPRDVLHFYPCDNEWGKKFLCDRRVSCVILTGSYETARRFQSWRPSLPLLAETSGKNAMVITAQADRELAIKDLVRSAFGHSGQKCSAASLAIVEAEVYDDPNFRRQLCDAASSLHAGPSIDRRSIVSQIVIDPSANLQRALTTLDEGEEWLLEPRRLDNESTCWSPGIKLGVEAGSWFHRTECFGPVLGLMRATSLKQATEWQNATDFGLTAGLHTLDPAEIDWWKDQVQAGNLYINRPITGAIVQRQPFGGWKKSCIGPGAKAGGPNYVRSFYRVSEISNEENDYQAVWENHFAIEHDPSALKCESNVFRYRPSRGVILRLEHGDARTITLARLAAKTTTTTLTISIREEVDDSQFLAKLKDLAQSAEFLRTISTPSDEVLAAAYTLGLNWINASILPKGRIELTRWLREQSISETRHRYGHQSRPR